MDKSKIFEFPKDRLVATARQRNMNTVSQLLSQLSSLLVEKPATINFTDNCMFFDRAYVDVLHRAAFFDEIEAGKPILSGATGYGNSAFWQVSISICELAYKGEQYKKWLNGINLYGIYVEQDMVFMACFRDTVEINLIRYEEGSVIFSVDVSGKVDDKMVRLYNTSYSLQMELPRFGFNDNRQSTIRMLSVPNPEDGDRFDGHHAHPLVIKNFDVDEHYYAKIICSPKLSVMQCDKTGMAELTGEIQITDLNTGGLVAKLQMNKIYRLVAAQLYTFQHEGENVKLVKNVSGNPVISSGHVVKMVLQNRGNISIRTEINLIIRSDYVAFTHNFPLLNGFLKKAEVVDLEVKSVFAEITPYAPIRINPNRLHDRIADLPVIVAKDSNPQYIDNFKTLGGFDGVSFIHVKFQRENKNDDHYVAIYYETRQGHRLADVFYFPDVFNLQLVSDFANYCLDYTVVYTEESRLVASTGSFLLNHGEVFSVI